MNFEDIETWVRSGVEWLRLSVELLSAAVIAAGVVTVVAMIVRRALARTATAPHAGEGDADGGGFADVRLSFARFLMLALELQLAADILSTSIAPTWDRIGKLGAIAVIRTALNYFLSRELSGELAQRRTPASTSAPVPAPASEPASAHEARAAGGGRAP